MPKGHQWEQWARRSDSVGMGTGSHHSQEGRRRRSPSLHMRRGASWDPSESSTRIPALWRLQEPISDGAKSAWVEELRLQLEVTASLEGGQRCGSWARGLCRPLGERGSFQGSGPGAPRAGAGLRGPARHPRASPRPACPAGEAPTAQGQPPAAPSRCAGPRSLGPGSSHCRPFRKEVRVQVSIAARAWAL